MVVRGFMSPGQCHFVCLKIIVEEFWNGHEYAEKSLLNKWTKIFAFMKKLITFFITPHVLSDSDVFCSQYSSHNTVLDLLKTFTVFSS